MPGKNALAYYKSHRFIIYDFDVGDEEKTVLRDFHLVDLQFPDVVDGGLQDGALVLTDVADDVVIPAAGVEKNTLKTSPNWCSHFRSTLEPF